MASALMPSRIRINATTFAYPNLPGNPNSTQPKSALVLQVMQHHFGLTLAEALEALAAAMTNTSYRYRSGTLIPFPLIDGCHRVWAARACGCSHIRLCFS